MLKKITKSISIRMPDIDAKSRENLNEANVVCKKTFAGLLQLCM